MDLIGRMCQLHVSVTIPLQVTHLREQVLAEQEGRRADKLEADERVKYAQTENGYFL